MSNSYVKGDMRLVHSLVSADGFQSIDGYLGSNADMPAGCFAYVHSRRDSKLMVSSQMLVSNNEAIIASYSSDTQYALARDSYGEIPGRSPGWRGARDDGEASC